jgi:hypothetical protein
MEKVFSVRYKLRQFTVGDPNVRIVADHVYCEVRAEAEERVAIRKQVGQNMYSARNELSPK